MLELTETTLPDGTLQLSNVYVGLHTKLMNPDETVVTVFEFSQAAKMNSELARAMIYALQSRIGLPTAKVFAKLEDLDRDDLLKTFKFNFSRYRDLTVVVDGAAGTVLFASSTATKLPSELTAADFHLYRF